MSITDKIPLEAWFVSSKDKAGYPSQPIGYKRITMNQNVPFRVTNPHAIKDLMIRAKNKKFLTQINKAEAAKLIGDPTIFDDKAIERREFADDQIDDLEKKINDITTNLEQKDEVIMSLKTQLDQSKEVIEKYQAMEQKFAKLEKALKKK